MAEDRVKYFIFVGGAPRSGTTLVQNMLDSHPDILGGPEFMHLQDIVQLRKKMHGSIKKKRIDFYCSYEDVDKQISLFIESFFLPFIKKYEGKILSEKTPGNVFVFEELMELFPTSRYIHVVRDPRAIVASMLQVGKRAKHSKEAKTQLFTYSATAAINYIKRCFDIGFEVSRNSPDKVLTVVYEKLVIDPVSETKKICKFLDLDWSHDMIFPDKKNHLGEEAITHTEIWYDKDSYKRAPISSEIYKWKKQLNVIQKAIIFFSFFNYQELAELGYNISLKNIGMTTKIIYLSIGITWHLIYNFFHFFYRFIRKAPNIIYSKAASSKN
jgi:hypothetical protein